MNSDGLPFVAPGKRALILGKTGSGKTIGASWLLSRSPGRWVVLNSKHDEFLTSLAPSVEWNAKAIIKASKKHRVLIAHPDDFEPDVLDDVLFELCESRQAIGVFVDELMYLHKGNGRAGPGLMGLLTRGRSRKQSFIGCSQRPAYLSNFCYSESEYFGIYNLKLKADWSKVVEFSGQPSIVRSRANHQWAWVDVGEDALTEFKPVPLHDIARRFEGV
jgi:hypothetical protein